MNQARLPLTRTVRKLLPVALLGLVAACAETGGTTASAPTASAVGQDSTGDTVSVALRARGDGNQTVTLSAGLDYTCNGVLEDAPAASASELTNIVCTDGSTGTATLVYDATAQPSQFVFSRPGKSAGSIRF
ncbi:hypothetical protein AB0T83_18610 [Fluviibacterium sp. DFM31]|uniref:Lipoprotein n=1 Tax=Meridianimarinicoccus marinus TaxID=3231483 RepID=A0ABV3LB32_9RHOB